MSEREHLREGPAGGHDETQGVVSTARIARPLETDEPLFGVSGGGLTGKEQSAFFSKPLTQEKSAHLLSVIRASMGEEGGGEATSSGLDWTAAYNLVSVTVNNEGGGSSALVKAGRGFGWTMSGILGVVGGSMMAGVLEPITFGVFVGSVLGGVGIALGAGVAFSRGAKKRVAKLMDRIRRTMESMEDWPEVASGLQGDDSGVNGVVAARNIELLEALQDRREGLGPRVTARRVTYALALGASFVSVLPTALQFLPADYPLPWIVAGGLGWAFLRTVRGLVRGVRERKELDREIQARLAAPGGPTFEAVSEMGSS